MSKVRLAFVGVGGMGQCAHLRNYSIIPDCEVVAIAELRQDLAQKVAARYGIGRVYRDHKELFAGPRDFDAIVAIQQFGIHGQLVPELLAAGLPVITEKPLARSTEAGEKILAAQQKSKAKLYLAYHKRSDPATMYARRQIEAWKASGKMGRMQYVRITMPPGDWVASGFSQLLKSADKYPQIQGDPPQSGYGDDYKKYDGFVNYYIHQVNLMRHLLGENYRATFADAGGKLLIGQSDSGVTVTLEMAPFRTTIDWQEKALIAFEKGFVEVDLPAPMAIDRPGKVSIFEDPGEGATPQSIAPTLPHVHAMWQQAVNFVKAVNGESTCLCEAPEALEDLKIARQYLDLFLAAKPK